MKKILVVGAGLSGAVVARLAAESGFFVKLIEERSFVGGNCYDYRDDETGLIVHRYGPHFFHTNSGETWKFLSRFTEWIHCFCEVKGYVDGKLVPIPFNLDSIEQIFPKHLAEQMTDELIHKFGFGTKVSVLDFKNTDCIFDIGRFVFDKVFSGYTEKQWGVNPAEVAKSVLSRVPVRVSRDGRYFSDRYQGIPEEGYTRMIERMIEHPNIEVCLNTPFEYDVASNSEYEKIYYSGSIDRLFGYRFGRLPYRSLDFVLKKMPGSSWQPCQQINYPSNYDFTRIVDYSYFNLEKHTHTVVSFEYPKECKLEDERFYPIENEANLAIYDRYKEVLAENKKLIMMGRLGTYKYLNMDQVVVQAHEKFYESISGR